MLGIIAQVLQPPAIEGGQGDQHRDQPQVEIQRDAHDQGLTNELDARPGEKAAPQFYRRIREQVVFPCSFQLSEAQAQGVGMAGLWMVVGYLDLLQAEGRVMVETIDGVWHFRVNDS